MMRCIAAVVLLAGIACSTAWAGSSEVKFHGALYKLSCKVNNDQPVDISFGKVGVNKVDGVRYATAIPISIQCDEAPSAKLNLTITGNVSDFDSSAVQTTVGDLAIQIQQNGQPVSVGESFLVNEDNPPALVSVPVMRPGSKLVGGEFSAVATLIIQGD
ncbi:fimbrial protein [Enterobacter asburiae]|uniref:fimbrial protein n=1 Tax=Enterobacter asburiae TaxID=61645 RepID=UPI002C6FD89E|nr:fimbrial protein [Enterobacter asburiae]